MFGKLAHFWIKLHLNVQLRRCKQIGLLLCIFPISVHAKRKLSTNSCHES